MDTGPSRPRAHGDAIARFREVLQQCRLMGHCGRPFVRIQKLKEWFATESNTQRLLNAAYATIDYIKPPTTANTIDNGNDCALLVFSILLDLGQGALIHFFSRQELVDRHLPFRKWDLVDLYKNVAKDNLYRQIIAGQEPEALMEQFSTRQHAFCPITFQFKHAKDYNSERVLPVTRSHKTPINDKGGTASVWQISILEEFIDRRLRDAIESSRYEDKKDGLGPRYRLALKRFEQNNRQFYDTEKEAFQALADQSGMIQYLGEFCHSENNRNNYNILLEYGQLDLDEFFFDPATLPPVLSEEINSFWNEIFDVVDALKDVHSFKVRRDDVSHEYYGWHADIKPDNILRVNGKFKLADPGFASFKKADGKNKLKERAERRAEQKEAVTLFTGGTVTYGAPECHFGKRQQMRVTRAIDVWSLGCVLSVAATWVILGQQGILQFTRLRERAIGQLISRSNGLNRTEHDDVLLPGDYFHNGKEVLPVVKEWHKHLRGCKRASDDITHEILTLVDNKMLCDNPDSRISATDLHKELAQLLHQSQVNISDTLSQGFRDALQELDARIVSEPPQPEVAHMLEPVPSDHIPSAETKKMRKTILLNTPLKRTTNRSEALRSSRRIAHRSDALRNSQVTMRSSSSLSRRQDRTGGTPQAPVPTIVEPGNRPADGAPDITSASERIHRGSNSLAHPLRNSVILRPGAISAPEVSPFLRRTTGGSNRSTLTRATTAPGRLPRQNAFQARTDLDRRKGKIAAKGAGLLGLTPKKDDFLAKYFNRRDLHFLVDDADTMVEFWDEAIWLLSILVEKAVGQDENGMDMSFTNSTEEVRGSNKVKEYREKMEKARPKVNGGALTDMESKLGDILVGYLRKLQRCTDSPSLGEPRKLTLVVFTDGSWEGMADKNAIGKQIADFAKKMLDIEGNNLKKRQVSFQFVQFGNDEEARYRLWRLDNDLPVEENIPDMIDTTDSRGNVNKMLLGSFVPVFDHDD